MGARGHDGGITLAGGLRRKGLAWRLASGRLASCLLGAGHCFEFFHAIISNSRSLEAGRPARAQAVSQRAAAPEHNAVA